MNTDEQSTDTTEDEQAVPDSETTEDSDLDEQSSRLSKDRDDSPDEDEDEDTGGDTFPRPYVERLRARSAGYRTRATSAEARTTELEGALFTERVRALDVLADPTDLPYAADMLDDPEALSAAVADLVAQKPHLRRRGVSGTETGSRERHDGGEAVSLLGLMRGGA